MEESIFKWCNKELISKIYKQFMHLYIKKKSNWKMGGRSKRNFSEEDIQMAKFNSDQFSHSVMSRSLWPHGLQHARPPCLSPTARVYPNSCPLSQWCHPTISYYVVPSPPAFNLSQHQSLFQWVSSLHQVAKVLEFQLQHQSFQWTPRTDLL